MITLTTGLPGAGKTLWTLQYVENMRQKDGRQVFYSGIPELKLPWTECDPEKWYELPPGSIVVIDECQRIFRPRMHGAQVPEFVAKLETHRHLGIDLFLITQHPSLMDVHVRRLCGQHFHSVRTFGMQRSTVHEWSSVKDAPDKGRADSQAQHKFAYPKEVFGWYKSAEVHTHKRRIPMKLWVLAFIVLALPVLAFMIYRHLSKGIDGEVNTGAAQVQAAESERGQPAGAQGVGQSADSAEAYLAKHVPRVPGLPHTAPVYDEVTKPVRAPYPAACMMTKTRCGCYTQQGTRLDVSRDLCIQIAQGGFFMAWDENRAGQGGAEEARPVQAVARADSGARSAPLHMTQVAELTPSAAIVPPAPAGPAAHDGEQIAAARCRGPNCMR